MNRSNILIADEAMKSGGIFTATHIRNGEIIGVDTNHNKVTTEGLIEIGNRVFSTATQTPFYIALYTGAHTPLASDKAATFSSLASEYTAYNEPARPLYNPTNIDGLIANTASKAIFTFAESVTIRGIAVLTVPAKGATYGVLLSLNSLLAAKAFTAGDEFAIEYKFQFSAS